MHLVISTHFSFFWLVCHPSRTFPQKSLNGNPGFPFLPITRPYLLLPLTHGSPPLYWLGVSGWCLSLVLALLPYESMACLVFMRLPLLVGLFGPTAHSVARFNSLWRGWVIGSSFFVSRFFFGLGIAWVWVFSSLIQPLSPFTFGLWANWYSCPCHCIVTALISFNLCLLDSLWACHASFMCYSFL